MRELPRKLSVEQLSELFEGRTRFVERLAELDDPLGRARELAARLTPAEQKEVLDAHPAIGASGLSARSAAEQGGDEAPELAELNRRYEERFGFRFVVFVNRRPKRELVPIIRSRLERTREQELATALDELVAIAEDQMAAFLAPSDYWWEWGDLVFRWLHVVAAIAWIGSSFYFIALDHHLVPPARPEDAEAGVGGEVWEIHGGGFYRIEKFRVAPRVLPETLHWFKWEAYTTWLSGFALLVVVYFSHASTFLVDRSVADLSTSEAIAIAIGGLALAWLVYDAFCRLLGRHELALATAVAAGVALAAFGASRLFAPQAAYIEVGAMLGTVMAGNVLFVIIPAHWELVRAKQAGREPDARWNARAKQRSVHNNYLTLPVLFAMLSYHFPFTYGSRHAWLVLVALMALGAWIRHYFNLRHVGRNAWWIPASAAIGLAVLVVALRPAPLTAGGAGPAPSFAAVQAIIATRCAACHSPSPTEPGYASPPMGIVLDTRAEIESQASLIRAVAVDSDAMPLANATGMTSAERSTLARWLASR